MTQVTYTFVVNFYVLFELVALVQPDHQDCESCACTLSLPRLLQVDSSQAQLNLLKQYMHYVAKHSSSLI